MQTITLVQRSYILEIKMPFLDYDARSTSKFAKIIYTTFAIGLAPYTLLLSLILIRPIWRHTKQKNQQPTTITATKHLVSEFHALEQDILDIETKLGSNLISNNTLSSY